VTFFLSLCPALLALVGLAQGAARRPKEKEVFYQIEPQCAAYSPDGKRVAIGFYGRGKGYSGPQLKIWNVATRSEVNFLAPGEGKYHAVSFVAYLPGGKEILTVEDDDMCRIWNADEGKLVRQFSVEEWGAAGASMTADGKKLMTRMPSGFVIWDVPTGKALEQREIPASHNGFAISPDGKRAIFRYNRTGSFVDPTFSIYWDLEKDKAIQHLKYDEANREREEQRTVLLPLLFSPDGRYVLTRKQKGLQRDKGQLEGLVLCDPRDLSEVKTIAEMKPTAEIIQGERATFSADGKRLFFVTLGRKDPAPTMIHLRDLSKNEDVWSTPRPQKLNEGQLLVCSPTNEQVLFVREMTLFDCQERKILGKLPVRGFPK
jgi:hypothetical protein